MIERRRWIPLLLVAAIVAAYANTFNVPFIFDDIAITQNPYIRHLWPATYLFHAPNQSTVAGRPLVSLTLALNFAISGLQPWSFHVVNLLLHAGCALLLYGIVRRTMQQDWTAFAIAAIWAVHPLLTESVTYTIQRTELLMAFFLLLTIYCVIREWHLSAVAACAAGMASKEVMVVAPLMVFLYDRTFLAGTFREAWRKRNRLYVALAGTWVILALIIASKPRGESVTLVHTDISPAQYALTQCGVILHYLKLAVWPAPLVVDYDDWPVAKSFLGALPQILPLSLLLLGVLWALRCKPWLGFLGAAFFLILAPTSSVVPIITEVAAERRMYLPLIPIVALLVVLASKLPVRRILAVVAITLLVALTLRRNWDYRSTESIWSDVVAKRPGNVRALVNLGAIEAERGRAAAACEFYQKAVALDPVNAEAHYNLGIALAGQGRNDEALPHLQQAAAISSNSLIAQYNYGLLLGQLGRFAEAEAALNKAISLEPDSPSAQKQLGVVLAKQGRFQEALPHFETAVRLRPADEEAQRLVVMTLSRLSATNQNVR